MMSLVEFHKTVDVAVKLIEPCAHVILQLSQYMAVILRNKARPDKGIFRNSRFLALNRVLQKLNGSHLSVFYDSTRINSCCPTVLTACGQELTHAALHLARFDG
jgi:hypothetical protein